MARKNNILKSVLLLSTLLLVSIFVGSMVGNSFFINLKNKNGPLNANFSYKDNINDLNFSDNESPSDRIASDAYNYATTILSKKNYYLIKGSGIVDIEGGMLGKLKLWGQAEKLDNNIHTYIIAHNNLVSKYQVGLKYDYDIEKDFIDFYWGKSKSDGTAEWKEPSQLTPKQYFDEWGLPATEFFTYTISRTTALKNNKPNTFWNNGKKFYSYSIPLNPNTSTENYAIQLKKMSDLPYYPIFNYVTFNFILDENFVFQSVEIKENWELYYYGFLLNCTSNINYTFKY